jgi:hypothetical protein
MSPLLGSFHSELKCRCVKVSAVAFAIHEKNEKKELSILAIQIEQLLVFEVTQQRLMVCLIVRVLKGPTFALSPFWRASRGGPLGLPFKQN